MSLKDKIVNLRGEGLTYLEIMDQLNCAKGTVSYHLGSGVKEKQIKRQVRNRTKNITELKQIYGAACVICNYSKCMKALDFHHVDPSTKLFEISDHKLKVKEIAIEAKKCVLLCSNCHRELHHGLLTILEFKI